MKARQLVFAFATRGRNKGAVKIVPKPGGSLLYTLRTITRHRPDRGILPTGPAISAAAAKAVADFVESFGGVRQQTAEKNADFPLAGGRES